MCGVVGEVRREGLRSAATRHAALGCVAHRGPDAQGEFVDDNLWFAHARLSVIDLSSAADQPMATPDRRHAICYNGEVYNFTDIARKLELRDLRTSSDTEVVLRAYIERGPASFTFLNGIFAFAVYDKGAQQIILARDRLGVKPLYYVADDNGLAFASEIKALRTLGAAGSCCERDQLHEWTYYGTTLGERTLYRGVRKLLPGHYLVFDLSTFTFEVIEYWSPIRYAGRPKQHGTSAAIIARTRFLLEQAVQRQLVSDVPVGVFLSGGVDSSAITAFASRHYAGKLATYSAGFDFDKGVNELPAARAIAEEFATDHHELHISGFELPDVICRMVAHHDQPFSDAANIPLFLLSERVKHSTKVVLQGDGGDELFGGYTRYSTLRWVTAARHLAPFAAGLNALTPHGPRHFRHARYARALSASTSAEIMALLLTEEDRSDEPEQIFADQFRREIVRTDPFSRYRQLQKVFAAEDAVNQMLFIDSMIILPDVFLEKVDRSTMAAAVEVRVPFLDNDLVEHCFSLSGPQKVRSGRKKWLLKKALEGVVPDHVLRARKTGFGVPFGYWLKGSLRSFLFDQLSTFDRRFPDVLNVPKIEQLFQQHLHSERDRSFLLWKVLMLTTWANQTARDFRF